MGLETRRCSDCEQTLPYKGEMIWLQKFLYLRENQPNLPVCIGIHRAYSLYLWSFVALDLVKACKSLCCVSPTFYHLATVGSSRLRQSMRLYHRRWDQCGGYYFERIEGWPCQIICPPAYESILVVHRCSCGAVTVKVLIINGTRARVHHPSITMDIFLSTGALKSLYSPYL